MNTFKNPATRITAAQQAAMYHLRKRNRMARAPASPVGEDRERLPIDTPIDMPIDNPDAE